MNRETLRKRAVRFVPLLLALICYVLCICFGGMKYHTNDDTAIQSTLSGAGLGTPFPAHPFISVLISYPLAGLYRLLPGVNWWFLYSHLLTFAGFLAVNLCIAYPAERNGYPLFPAFCLAAVTDIAFFLYPVSYISFTIVAGVDGTGAAALLLMSGEKHRRTRVAAAGILYVLAVCHRGDSGIVSACYILLAMLYTVLCSKPEKDRPDLPETEKKGLKRPGLREWAAVLAAGIILFAGTTALIRVNRAVQNRINGEDFVRFNSARSSFMDYPVDSYGDNPQIYEDVGWDETTYQLVRNHWCFLDDAVTTENFRYLSGHSKTERRSASLKTLLSRWNTLQQDQKTRGIGWVWLMISAAALISIILNRDIRQFLIWLLNTAGTAALVLYQLYTGRIIYRTLIICLLPSVLLHLPLLMNRPGGSVKRKIFYLVCALTLLFCLPALTDAISPAFDPTEKQTVLNDEIKSRKLKEYTLSHRDNLYIKQTRVTKDRSPVRTRSDGKPSNVIGWGGSGYLSKSNRLLLEANGIDRLNGDLFRRDNVRLISSTNIVGKNNRGRKVQDTNVLVLFYRWMKQKYNATGIIQEDTVCKNVYIYKVLFDEPDSDEPAYDYADGRFVLIQQRGDTAT